LPACFGAEKNISSNMGRLEGPSIINLEVMNAVLKIEEDPNFGIAL